jgi:CheY-like chemotaxis protein
MLSIVVMDEDAAMKALMTEWLEAEGHRIVPWNTGAEQRGPELVVFNIVNVRSSGAELTRQLAAAYPGAALIGISAQLSASLPLGSALPKTLGLCRLLAKPLARDEFLAAIVACIDPAS